MRKPKNTRTKRCCFTKFIKEEGVKNKEVFQIAYDRKNDQIILDENAKIQGMSKTMYICRKTECISRAIKKNISAFLQMKRDLNEEEILRIRKYAN